MVLAICPSYYPVDKARVQRSLLLRFVPAMKSASSLHLGFLLLLLASQPSPSWAGQDASGDPSSTSQSKLLRAPQRAAERLLREGDSAGALVIYESLDADELSVTDQYNQGVALYQAQRFDESAEAFRAAAAASDPKLAAKARFNLGNTDYAKALAALEDEDAATTPKAIESLRNAIESYRSVLRLTPDDTDARFNLELAHKLIRELEQQTQKDEQEQQDKQANEPPEQPQPQESSEPGEKNQQDPSQNSSSGEDQEANGESQDSPEDGSEQDGSEQDKENSENGEQSEQQSGESTSQAGNEPGPESGPESEQSEPAEQPEPSDAEKENSDGSSGQTGESEAEKGNPSEPSESAGDNPPTRKGNEDGVKPESEPEAPQPQSEDDSEPQPTSEGELSAANPSEDPQDAGQEPQRIRGEPLQMTQEEARKLLQAIRDRDMLRRLQRQAAQRARQIPVERDW